MYLQMCWSQFILQGRNLETKQTFLIQFSKENMEKIKVNITAL